MLGASQFLNSFNLHNPHMESLELLKSSGLHKTTLLHKAFQACCMYHLRESSAFRNCWTIKGHWTQCSATTPNSREPTYAKNTYELWKHSLIRTFWQILNPGKYSSQDEICLPCLQHPKILQVFFSWRATKLGLRAWENISSFNHGRRIVPAAVCVSVSCPQLLPFQDTPTASYCMYLWVSSKDLSVSYSVDIRSDG